jgi:hypothetical protein
MRAVWVRWVALAGAVWAGACAHRGVADNPNVSLIGQPRPSRGPDCELQVFFATLPPYQVDEIASTRVSCSGVSGGREGCVGLIKQHACETGSDTVFGFRETVGDGRTYMSATLGLRREAPPPAPGTVATPASVPSGVAGEASCSPICSPGFACAAGQCIPQCNPPCEAGETCSRKRICEPAGAGAPPAGVTAPRGAGAPPPTANPALAPSWPPPPSSPPAPPILPPRGRPARAPESRAPESHTHPGE